MATLDIVILLCLGQTVPGQLGQPFSHSIIRYQACPALMLHASLPTLNPKTLSCLQVSTKQAAVDGLGSEFVIPVSPFSVNVLSISLSSPQCGHDIGAQLQMQARSVV